MNNKSVKAINYLHLFFTLAILGLFFLVGLANSGLGEAKELDSHPSQTVPTRTPAPTDLPTGTSTQTSTPKSTPVPDSTSTSTSTSTPTLVSTTTQTHTPSPTSILPPTATREATSTPVPTPTPTQLIEPPNLGTETPDVSRIIRRASLPYIVNGRKLSVNPPTPTAAFTATPRPTQTPGPIIVLPNTYTPTPAGSNR